MKILIVDDIFTNRLLLVEILKSLGHEYMQAENGKEAIEIIRNNDFDIVLMDLHHRLHLQHLYLYVEDRIHPSHKFA